MDKILFINACVRPNSRTLALAKTFYGIEDVQCVKAEGLDVYGADVSALLEEATRTFHL